MSLSEKVAKAEYLELFRQLLAALEEDFPNRFLDHVGLQGPDGLKGILNSDNLTRWACVEAWMYTFTREDEYLARARNLLLIVIGLIENTPEMLWRYVHPKDPETTEAIRKAYAAFPGSGWHIGGFSNQIGYGDCCRIIERFGAWNDSAERGRARDAGAALCDYRLEKSGFFHFDDECRNNRTLTSARGVFRVAEAFADHPSASRWREWALRQFEKNLNQPSDEDATGYQSDWFHSILNIIEYLDLGENQHYTPHHRSYFEHFRDLILPGGYCASYGDSGGTNSAHLPILEKGATVFGDGTYKLAAADLFRRLIEREPETARQQLGSLRWIDAYRWADDSIETEFPVMTSKVTSEGTLLLRSGDESDYTYLTLTSNDQTSKTGSGHGHVDANAINCWAHDGVPLLEDGDYQWKESIFHNRVLWRKGEPPGEITDYFSPTKTAQHWDLKDSSKMVYSREGPAEGVPESWYPDEAVDIRVEFLVQLPSYTIARSTLGIHERTIFLDATGRILIFDSIAADEPVTSVCLFHGRTILRRGENWVQVQSSEVSENHSGLILNLEPALFEVEQEVRKHGEENLIFARASGTRSVFTTVFLPVSPEVDPSVDVAEVAFESLGGGGGGEDSARLVHLANGSSAIAIGCRCGSGGKPIEYAHGVRTDAALIVFSVDSAGVLDLCALQATVVEREGRRIASAVDPEDFHLTVGG